MRQSSLECNMRYTRRRRRNTTPVRQSCLPDNQQTPTSSTSISIMTTINYDVRCRHETSRQWDNSAAHSFRTHNDYRKKPTERLGIFNVRRHPLSTHLSHHRRSHHPSLLHSILKTYFFNKSFPP